MVIGRARRYALLRMGVVVLVAAISACTDSSRLSSHNTAEAPRICAHAGQAGVPIGVGPQVTSRSAPTVGPIRFGFYPYERGYPTKVLIYAWRRQSAPIAIRGVLCTRPDMNLHFWYRAASMPPPPPYGESRMRTIGDRLARLAPVPAGESHTGYMLFTEPGQWALTVTQADKVLGVLVVHVAPHG